MTPKRYRFIQDDAFAWLARAARSSIQAVVTDPPYGLIEYTESQLTKRKNGSGGVWRIPPSFDGCKRSPLPRFTVLKDGDLMRLRQFFVRFSTLLYPVLVPGAHVFVATNPLLSHLVYEPFVLTGFEKRGELIRQVQTLRGGDRPKNAHKEFDNVSVMPRSCFEPWGIFRKPCEGRVQDNLRKWGTGGLRRLSPYRAVQGRSKIVSRTWKRAGNCTAPIPEASSLSASGYPCMPTDGYRMRPRSICWCRIYNSGGNGLWPRQHRN